MVQKLPEKKRKYEALVTASETIKVLAID